MKNLLLLSLLIPLVGCTFVKLAPGADRVRVARMDADLSACSKRGEIEVNVKDRLGPYARNPVQVADELETLARNEAPGLKADTLQPVKAAEDGYQRFAAFDCAGVKPGTASGAKDAQTFPVKE